MKTKTLVKEYNKLVDKENKVHDNNKKLKHDLNDLYAELHMILANGFEHDNQLADVQNEVNKYKHRALIAEHKYKSCNGKLIQLQHVINRDSDENQMEFH